MARRGKDGEEMKERTAKKGRRGKDGEERKERTRGMDGEVRTARNRTTSI